MAKRVLRFALLRVHENERTDATASQLKSNAATDRATSNYHHPLAVQYWVTSSASRKILFVQPSQADRSNRPGAAFVLQWVPLSRLLILDAEERLASVC